MNNTINIAKNTITEAIRDKIFLGIMAFAFLFIAATVFLGSISLGEDLKVIKDLGLAGIYVSSLLITIFLGTSLIYKEIEKRTIYIILSKPISTVEYILGKFLGLFSSVFITVFAMTAFYIAVIMFKGGGFDSISLIAVLLMIFEIAVIIAISILFSTFTTPLAGTIYTLMIVYIGHSLDLLHKSGQKSGAFVKYLFDGIYYIFPNLEKFNFRNEVVYGHLPNSGQIIYPIIYSVLLCTILLWLANLAIRKRDY